MANKKGEDILGLFSQELDGESFDSDDDAKREMNISYRNILADRDWHILKKTATLAAGIVSLAGITDLDKVLSVWANMSADPTDVLKLKKANFDQRFDPNFDYWIDHANNEIKWIDSNAPYAVYSLFVDYKYKPDDLDDDTEIVFPDIGYPAIAYDMILAFKEKDTDPDFYDQIVRKKERAMNLLIDWNEQLNAQD